MVWKRCKGDEYNTGCTLRYTNTSRRKQIRSCFKISFPEVEGLLEVVEQELWEAYFEGSGNDSCALGSLKALLEVAESAQTCMEAGVEYSLDKGGRWLLLDDIERRAADLCRYGHQDFRGAKLGVSFSRESLRGKDTVYDSQFRRVRPSRGTLSTSCLGAPLPYKASWRRQRIYRNQHFRGIQRAAHLLRKKRLKGRRANKYKNLREKLQKMMQKRRRRRRRKKKNGGGKAVSHVQSTSWPYCEIADLSDDSGKEDCYDIPSMHVEVTYNMYNGDTLDCLESWRRPTGKALKKSKGQKNKFYSHHNGYSRKDLKNLCDEWHCTTEQPADRSKRKCQDKVCTVDESSFERLKGTKRERKLQKKAEKVKKKKALRTGKLENVKDANKELDLDLSGFFENDSCDIPVTEHMPHAPVFGPTPGVTYMTYRQALQSKKTKPGRGHQVPTAAGVPLPAIPESGDFEEADACSEVPTAQGPPGFNLVYSEYQPGVPVGMVMTSPPLRKKKRKKCNTHSNNLEKKGVQWSQSQPATIQQPVEDGENRPLELVSQKGNGTTIAAELQQLDRRVSSPSIHVPLWKLIGWLVQETKSSKNVELVPCPNACTGKRHSQEIIVSPAVPKIVPYSLLTEGQRSVYGIEKGGQEEQEKHQKDAKSVAPQCSARRKKRRKTHRVVSDNQVPSELKGAPPSKDDWISDLLSAKPGVKVKVKDSSLRPSYLKRKFGDLYQEGSCFPRLFWVDVSDQVRETPQGHEDACDKEAVLMVQCLGSASLADKSLPSQHVLVQLKVELTSAGKWLMYERLRQLTKAHLLYPLVRVIQYFVKVCKELAAEGLRLGRNVRPHAVSPVKNTLFNWLSTVNSWSYDTYSSHEACTHFKLTKQELQRPSTSDLCRRQYILQSEPRRQTPPASSSPRFYHHPIRPCDVCSASILLLSDLGVPEKITAVGMNGYSSVSTIKFVSLLACAHALCGRCLHDHATAAVKDGKEMILCPVADCSTVLDPVVVLSCMSLLRFNKHLTQLRDEVVHQHPQWEWCPKQHCHRAVKLNGTGLLDAATVVQCGCGAVWCFHCRTDAHWPATCHQARIYRTLSLDSVISDSHLLRRRLCASCHNQRRAVRQRHPATTSDCSCVYLLCQDCLRVPTSPFTTSRSTMKNTVISVDEDGEQLLPQLLYHSAIVHGLHRTSYNQTQAENRATVWVRHIMKSRSFVGTSVPHPPDTSHPAGGSTSSSRRVQLVRRSMPAMSHCGTNIQIAPNLQTERLFLILVQQFMFQAHFLLEHTYILLYCSRTDPRETTILSTMVQLERVLAELQQCLDGVCLGPASAVACLKTQMEEGKVLLVTIATEARSLQGGGSAAVLTRTDTVVPLKARLFLPTVPRQPRNLTL